MSKVALFDLGEITADDVGKFSRCDVVVPSAHGIVAGVEGIERVGG